MKRMHLVEVILGGCFKTRCGLYLDGVLKEHGSALPKETTCKNCQRTMSDWERRDLPKAAIAALAVVMLLAIGCGGDAFSANGPGSGAGGSAGIAGSSGSGGAAGASGQAGGTSGQAGAQGGSAGTSGAAGATGGSAGVGGAAGIAGSSGSGGAAGASGSSGGTAGQAGSAGGSAGTAGSGGAAGAAGSAGSGGGASGAAGSGGAVAPDMVLLPEGFAIDIHEVTRAEYAAWLATSPASGAYGCAPQYNPTYQPDAACMAEEFVCQTNCDNHPQVCVDWCDANAFCADHGKRLCGRIGGGPNGTYYANDVSRSQWYYACTSNGAYVYPYGATYDGNACSYSNTWGTTTVGYKSACTSDISPYDQIRDLSGNVMEWTDECDNVGAGLPCHTRGGSFFNGHDSVHTRCDDSTMLGKYEAKRDVGFRCCAD
jgi:sulfatase modifying factor 1